MALWGPENLFDRSEFRRSQSPDAFRRENSRGFK